MYAVLYNRLCGWAFLFLAAAGFTFGHVGEYMHLNRMESILFLIFGGFFIIAARSRLRYSVTFAFFLGLLVAVWGIWGIVSPASAPGSTDPLENAVRVVLGAWGVYTAVQDILTWRGQSSS